MIPWKAGKPISHRFATLTNYWTYYLNCLYLNYHTIHFLWPGCCRVRSVNQSGKHSKYPELASTMRTFQNMFGTVVMVFKGMFGFMELRNFLMLSYSKHSIQRTLKAVDTIGNCQRQFTVGVSQHAYNNKPMKIWAQSVIKLAR